MKIYIIKDGRKISDFKNERDALIWLAGCIEAEVGFAPNCDEDEENDEYEEEENEAEEWYRFWFDPSNR